jgi:glycosyltransferase involved in cell wall biosynthesis
MSQPRVAFVTNLCPYYRRPLFERIAESVPTTFYFHSREEERYLGSAVRHELGAFPVRDVARISILGQPLLIGLSGELRADRYDVIVKCINGRLMMPYVYSLSRRRKLPFVLWSSIWHHPESLAHRVTRPLVERIYRGSDAIVVYGEHVRRHVIAVGGVEEGKTFVAGQAVDPERFLAVTPSSDAPARALFVGRLEAEKGVDDLLEAFAKISDPGVRLGIAGTGPLEGEVRARAANDPRIELLGHVPQAELPGELAASRLLVLPSVTTRMFREPWGLVVNEGMAAGTPVIATDAVGAAAGGLVRDGRNGLVVPERRPDALARAMSALFEDPTRARSLGDRARGDVAEFSHERMAQAFLAAIDHALTTHGRGRTVRSA